MRRAFVAVPAVPRDKAAELQADCEEYVRELGNMPIDIPAELPTYDDALQFPQSHKRTVADAIRLVLTNTDVLYLAPGWNRSRHCQAFFYLAGLFDIEIVIIKPSDIWDAKT